MSQSEPLIIGIDAGTSIIKAVAFSLDGSQIAVASTPNSYDELPGGGAVQDQMRTWDDLSQVLRGLGQQVDDLSNRTAAMAVTGQGDGTWLIDEQGEPVGPGWLWLDSRAASIVEELANSGVGDQFYRQTGCTMNGCNQSAQLLWMARHEPDVLRRATTAFHCKDWLYFKLTGQRATDPSEGIFTFGNYQTRQYVPELIDALGIAEFGHLLPKTIDGTQTTHALSAQAAKVCGLKAGTPVSLGFVDVLCTGLGGGMWDPNKQVGCSILGTTGMHMQTLDADKLELVAKPTGYTMPFMVPDMVAKIQSNMVTTLNIDWIADMAAEAATMMGRPTKRMEALLALDARIIDAEPCAAIYHPYISDAGERGPFVDANARASFNGLTTHTSFINLARSVYEGLALAAHDCYAKMGKIPVEIRVTGGAARSKALKTILASVLNSPIQETTREEAGAAGAAIMAAVATGIYSDMAQAVAHWVQPTLAGRIDPDPSLVKSYRAQFPLYQQIRQSMPANWQAMADVKRKNL